MGHELSDSQVDLCGELGHEDDSFSPIALDDPFDFCCRGCGSCCRGRQDIVLSGYDLYRLGARLRLPPELTVSAFCRLYIGSVSLLPVVRLQPRQDAGGSCPFLYQNLCSVHEAKPLVCALYPLGQTIGQDGGVSYFCQDTDCGGRGEALPLRAQLARAGILQRESLDVAWAQTNLQLSKRVRAAAPHIRRLSLKLAQRKITRALYLDYDPSQEYSPQWAENLTRLWPALDKLLGPE